jgi:hypothetical protein
LIRASAGTSACANPQARMEPAAHSGIDAPSRRRQSARVGVQCAGRSSPISQPSQMRGTGGGTALRGEAQARRKTRGLTAGNNKREPPMEPAAHGGCPGMGGACCTRGRLIARQIDPFGGIVNKDRTCYRNCYPKCYRTAWDEPGQKRIENALIVEKPL